jgi:hypothetical protein
MSSLDGSTDISRQESGKPGGHFSDRFLPPAKGRKSLNPRELLPLQKRTPQLRESEPEAVADLFFFMRCSSRNCSEPSGTEASCALRQERCNGWLCPRPRMRVAKKQMDVLRYDNIALDAQPEASSDALQRHFKGMFCQGVGERLSTAVTADGDKVSLSRFLESFQSQRYGLRVGILPRSSRKKA